ncbi:hypothetical protein B0T17DRAFT_73475 [Bombardia bombarda]|uniref:Uncharacterized protein n=1 Tax=Bombardia bombarda TaxID=252184 RepID=A0AA39XM99_9PEZI|nr:hypothetical protein B0T17DRAFT_73475 [Bombardia bombarda]
MSCFPVSFVVALLAGGFLVLEPAMSLVPAAAAHPEQTVRSKTSGPVFKIHTQLCQCQPFPLLRLNRENPKVRLSPTFTIAEPVSPTFPPPPPWVLLSGSGLVRGIRDLRRQTCHCCPLLGRKSLSPSPSVPTQSMHIVCCLYTATATTATTTYAAWEKANSKWCTYWVNPRAGRSVLFQDPASLGREWDGKRGV